MFILQACWKTSGVRLVRVLVEAEPRRDTGEQAGERGLAHRERFAPQVIAVKLDQVEGV